MPLPSACSGLPAVYLLWHRCWVNCSRSHATSTVLHMARLSPLHLENVQREPRARNYLASSIKYTIDEALRK